MECGLLVIRQDGRERYCEPQLKKIKEVALWAEKYKAFWSQKLDALEAFLGQENKPNS